MKAPHRPIPTTFAFDAPDGVDIEATESWVRRRTSARINLDNYVIDGPRETRKFREKFLKYARLLQKELLKYETRDGIAIYGPKPLNSNTCYRSNPAKFKVGLNLGVRKTHQRSQSNSFETSLI